MSTEFVKIAELNEENWYECCGLEVSAEQRGFIEPNAVSIAQSKFEPSLKLYAIYFEETVVGFLMYNSVQEELDGYWVYRIMVDRRYQGKGIGKAATNLMISEMAKLPNAKKLLWVTTRKIQVRIIYTRAWDLWITVTGLERKWLLLSM